MTITSKLPDIGTTIFTTMSTLAATHGAINLSQGFPDFDTPPALIDRVAKHMHAGQNQYAPMQGVLALRERIAGKVGDLYGISADPETEIEDVSFARQMTVEHKVAAIPPSVFYHDHADHRVLRFCFAKKNATLAQAAEILCKI